MQSEQKQFAPRRSLGKTGFVATVLGIGDIADRRLPLEQCVATVRRALDAGLNLVDTAPGYEDGYSEQIVGEAMKGRGREELFVIDKIDLLDDPVGPQVDSSLRRMGLAYADAFVLHALSSMEAWEKAVRPGGSMDQLAEAVRAGKCRWRGISSHDPDVLRAAILSGTCDVAMFAVGAYVHARYVEEILPLARKHNVGTVCFKTFGAGKLVGDTVGYNQPLQDRPRGKVSSGGSETAEATLPRLTVRECLHYTLTCDPDVALLGMSFPNEQDAAFEAARDFRPLSHPEMQDIKRRAAKAIEGKGKVWWNPGGV
jgi:aryl-alcohol dehydrogenase-like predicted oxidoreductase